MNGEAFLDTNVLIYAVQGDDPRGMVAAELLAAGGIISVQVLNEFASTVHRTLKRSWPEVRAALADLRILCPDVRPIGTNTYEAALALAERDGFSFYDALVIASALDAGCTTLWSEDMRHGRVVDGRLLIRNPFTGPGAS